MTGARLRTRAAHPPTLIAGRSTLLRLPHTSDVPEFLALVAASRTHLRPWIDPPRDDSEARAYLRNPNPDRLVRTLICARTGATAAAPAPPIAGAINFNEITRGRLQSAYLGYWIGAPFANQGLMTEALHLALRYAFTTLKLHRLEANIQPENTRSIRLVRRCGFTLEGFSPRYLKINGRWCDHQRWAIRVEQWRHRRTRSAP